MRHEMLKIGLIYTYICWGFYFAEAVVENQMTSPQIVRYPHLLRGLYPCVCVSGVHTLGGFHTNECLVFSLSKI